MILVWFLLVMEILLFSLLKPLINETEIALIILIGINIFFVIIYLGKYKKSIGIILYSAFTIRILTMFWAVFGRNIYVLPHSGGDTEGFLNTAFKISNDLSLLTEDVYGGLYSKILGILFHLVGDERIIGQYLNVVIGITIILLTYRILIRLEIDKKITRYLMILLSFFPTAIIFSSILLRENIITLFVTLSFYFFILWFKKGGNKNIILTFAFLLLASTFHAGVIGISFGYLFMIMFYNPYYMVFQSSFRSILIFLVAIIGIPTLYFLFGDLFFHKFNSVGDINDIFERTNRRRGGSSYLSWLNINAWWQMILFSPAFMFYFLVSPLPFNFRGMNDFIAFFSDGIFYFIAIIYSLFNIKKSLLKKPLIIGMIIMLLSDIFIFGVSVQNAGTAIRHRHKILPLIIVFFGLFIDFKLKRRRTLN